MSLMLLLQLVAMLVIITSSGGGEALGGACFYTMLAAFCFGAFLGVGLKTGLKVAKERGQDSAGLVFASAIGPYKIIRGKTFFRVYSDAASHEHERAVYDSLLFSWRDRASADTGILFPGSGGVYSISAACYIDRRPQHRSPYQARGMGRACFRAFP